MLHVVKRFVTDLNDVLHGWYGITWRVRNRNSTLTLCLSLSLSGIHVVLLFTFGGFFSVCDGIWFVFSFTYSIDLARGWEHIVLDTTFDESVSLKLLLEWTRRNTPKLYFYGILCYFYGNDGKSLILQTTDDRTQLKMIIWELVLKQSLWIFFKIFTESLNLGQFFYRASTYCLHVAMKHGTLIYFKLP